MCAAALFSLTGEAQAVTVPECLNTTGYAIRGFNQSGITLDQAIDTGGGLAAFAREP